MHSEWFIPGPWGMCAVQVCPIHVGTAVKLAEELAVESVMLGALQMRSAAPPTKPALHLTLQISWLASGTPLGLHVLVNLTSEKDAGMSQGNGVHVRTASEKSPLSMQLTATGPPA